MLLVGRWRPPLCLLAGGGLPCFVLCSTLLCVRAGRWPTCACMVFVFWCLPLVSASSVKPITYRPSRITYCPSCTAHHVPHIMYRTSRTAHHVPHITYRTSCTAHHAPPMACAIGLGAGMRAPSGCIRYQQAFTLAGSEPEPWHPGQNPGIQARTLASRPEP